MVSDKKIKTSLLFLLYSHPSSASAQGILNQQDFVEAVKKPAATKTIDAPITLASQNIEFSVFSEVVLNQFIKTENVQNYKTTDSNSGTSISPQLVGTSGIDPNIQSVTPTASQNQVIPSAVVSTKQQSYSQTIFSIASLGSIEDSQKPSQEYLPQPTAQVSQAVAAVSLVAPVESTVAIAVPTKAAETLTILAEIAQAESQKVASSLILPQTNQQITVTQVLGNSLGVLPTNAASNTDLQSVIILQSAASADIAAPVVADVQKNETLANNSELSSQASSKGSEYPANKLPSISETILQYNNSFNDTLSQQPKKVSDKLDNVNADNSEAAVLNPGDAIQPVALNATLPAVPNTVIPSVTKIEVPNAQNT
ncbi:hypothetical protein AYI70_g10252, partial [Smittium culicis]